MSYHVPILLPQVLTSLAIQSQGWYIDATVGGGGYTVEILRQGGFVLGIDTDREAIEHTRQRLQREVPESVEQKAWRLVHDNFRNIQSIVQQQGITTISGILFDLGISSHQIDTGRRGMSFRFPDQPLDLRLNQEVGETASHIVNSVSKEELYEILARYGEEELAITIADRINSARRIKPIITVGDLVESISSVIKRDKEGTLARVFQALRIAVNDELGALKAGLEGANQLLPIGGRLAVLSFHSLEDRIVKQFMRNGSWKAHPIIRADEEEIGRNRRSRSAKLRVAEKL